MKKMEHIRDALDFGRFNEDFYQPECPDCGYPLTIDEDGTVCEACNGVDECPGCGNLAQLKDRQIVCDFCDKGEE